MADWKNSDFWIKAGQLHERLLQKQELYKKYLDIYAANIEEAGGTDSPADQLVAEAKKHIMTVYQEVYGVNIYLSDFMLNK